MDGSEKQVVIRISPKDNVGVAAVPGGLPEGTLLQGGIRVLQKIPMGHKVAFEDIAECSPIIRYGQAIGQARCAIAKGEWVHESNLVLPVPPDLQSIPLAEKKFAEPPKLEGYTFMGYRNADGSVGTRNILAISTSVHCVAGFLQHVADKIKRELLPLYPNVDDVVAIQHTYGCGIAIHAPSAAIPVRTIQNILRNPNFGGEVLLIGLGCEKLRPESLLSPYGMPEGQPGGGNLSDIMYMQDEALYGFSNMVGRVLKMAEERLKRLNKRKREICPASELVVGMQCGGSDAFSGITSNPAAGYAADLIVRAGGSVMFSEVTEVRDAVHLLVPRTVSPEVGKALLDEMKWYDDYLRLGQADRSDNPTPGNKLGGLSNIVEKALGSIAKSGTSPIVDVLGPGEKIRKKGLTFAATPASDFVCGTLQFAAGMNMHVFMTGRGTPYGLAMVPVIKVGSNSALSSRWFDLIDLDAGQIATGEKSVEEMGRELFHLILDVASGVRTVACDRLGLHNDLVLFNPGPIT